MDIYLERVGTDKKDVLYRLLEYSLFEESLNDGNEMNENAIFEYEYFDTYFTDKDRDPFIIREKETDKILGFVMINEYVQKVEKGHSISEYMVIPKYRRQKIGKKVAFECFNMYSGYWEVSPSIGSEQAYLFWKNVIGEYTNNEFEYSDGIFVFKSNKN